MKNYLYFRNQSAITHVLLTCLLEMAGDGITTNGASTHLSSVKFVTKNILAKDDFHFTFPLSYLNTLFKLNENNLHFIYYFKRLVMISCYFHFLIFRLRFDKLGTCINHQ